MRILVISKRQYMGKDLLDDQYGRFFEIPALLARQGHTVHGIALSYRKRWKGVFEWPALPNMQWESLDLNLMFGLPGYLRVLKRATRDFNPDVVWACSDAYHAIIAAALFHDSAIPYVVDLYDNFESYNATRVPGITTLLRKSCRSAAAVSVVSNTLSKYVAKEYKVSSPILVLGNAIRDSLFQPQERSAARTHLGLPMDARLVGTAGALTRQRGIEDLFEAFLTLCEEDPDLWLVVAGPRDHIPSRYQHDRIIDKGSIPLADVPLLLAALDVGVICNRNNAFGQFCFPQKVYEMVACGVPVAAAAVGDTATMLAAHPESLYHPGSSQSLARTLWHQLQSPRTITDIPIPNWADRASQLSALFDNVTSHHTGMLRTRDTHTNQP